MSEFSAKTIRASRKAKAERLGSADPHTKVDSSDWTPAEPLNADVKTGARPLSRRAFKKGGKVVGEKAKANMGRKPRCGGGKAGDSWVNRNVKEANEEREGKKHVGGFKKGGRAKREYGGRGPGERTQHELKRRDAVEAASNYGEDPRVTEDVLRDKTRAFEKSAEQTAYKKGGRTKKMIGGPALDKMGVAANRQADFMNDAGWTMALTGKMPNVDNYKEGTSGGAMGPLAVNPASSLMSKIPTAKAKKGGAIKGRDDRKSGGRTKKMDGGMMGMPMMPPPDGRLNMVSPSRMKFSGAQGTPYKKGGKVAHGDEAMDRALIKKMVKPSARTGKADGGDIKKLAAGSDDSDAVKAAEGEYGKREDSVQRALNRIGNEFSGWKMRETRKGVADARAKNKDMQDFIERSKRRKDKESMEKAGYEKGGRTARATGGRTKGKGKTNINIIISAGPKGQQTGGPGGMPPGAPGGPMSLQRPMGPPPSIPGMPAGGPPGAPPQMGQPPMPPMARKSGGRITKVARSYKDMEAGAASGEGRLQKTDIAKRIPKKREDGVNPFDGRGYPNKVIGATGGRTAHKAGGKVYRSYKDMDAGAGSGMGRLEKEEIQRRKH